MAKIYEFSKREPRPPLALHDKAMDDLRYIRATMERSSAFTAVPGWGGVAVGVMALAAAPLAAAQTGEAGWVAVWVGTALLSAVVAGYSMVLKARKASMPVFSGPGRRFLLNFLPPMVAGGILTMVLIHGGQGGLLPGVWMLIYGTAILSAGAFSVPLVPLEGMAFMGLGSLAFVLPGSWADVLMATGFGGLHIVFGFLIARRHGG